MSCWRRIPITAIQTIWMVIYLLFKLCTYQFTIGLQWISNYQMQLFSCFFLIVTKKKHKKKTKQNKQNKIAWQIRNMFWNSRPMSKTRISLNYAVNFYKLKCDFYIVLHVRDNKIKFMRSSFKSVWFSSPCESNWVRYNLNSPRWGI